jgi:hypothetical protein
MRRRRPLGNVTPKNVIAREPFAFVILRERSDRRIWLRINSATEAISVEKWR